MEEVQESKNQERNEQKVEQKAGEKREEKPRKPNIISKIKEKLVQYNRVLEVASKPTAQELKSSMKITASGILLIGVIGFIIFIIYHTLIP